MLAEDMISVCSHELAPKQYMKSPLVIIFELLSDDLPEEKTSPVKLIKRDFAAPWSLLITIGSVTSWKSRMKSLSLFTFEQLSKPLQNAKLHLPNQKITKSKYLQQTGLSRVCCPFLPASSA